MVLKNTLPSSLAQSSTVPPKTPLFKHSDDTPPPPPPPSHRHLLTQATALGYYVNDPTALAAEPAAYTQYVESIKAVAPKQLPIIDWETGASTYNLTLAQQAEWATLMLETSKKEGVAGFNWWQFVDFAAMPSNPACVWPNVAHCELYHFGAHYTNGTAKPCWAVLAKG